MNESGIQARQGAVIRNKAQRAPPRPHLKGKYCPTSLSQHSRERFGRHRVAEYRTRIDGIPTGQQASLIQAMIKLEWASLVAEAQGDLVGLREAREHTRLFHKLLAEFEELLPPKPVRPTEKAKAKSGPPQIGIDDHLAQLGQRRGGGV